MKNYRIFLSIFVFYIIINTIINPSLYISQTLNGISAWAFNVLPSVLPFLFFTKVLSSTGALDKMSKVFDKPCKNLFKTPSISSLVFFTSIVSGYPVGAKMTADLYEQGKISKSDAFKMCSFCSTSGPMFIIGAVGISMLKNSTYGYIIFIAHILGAMLNGILYRNLKIKEDKPLKKQTNLPVKSNNLSEMVLDSALSIISVGTIIAIFFVVITSLSPIFNLFPTKISSIMSGLIEITKGCLDLSSAYSSKWVVVAATFIISFGGLSTIFQSIAMLNRLNMPISLFCGQKITQAIFACVIATILIMII